MGFGENISFGTIECHGCHGGNWSIITIFPVSRLILCSAPYLPDILGVRSLIKVQQTRRSCNFEFWWNLPQLHVGQLDYSRSCARPWPDYDPLLQDKRQDITSLTWLRQHQWDMWPACPLPWLPWFQRQIMCLFATEELLLIIKQKSLFWFWGLGFLRCWGQ